MGFPSVGSKSGMYSAQSMQRRMQYHIILNKIITAPEWVHGIFFVSAGPVIKILTLDKMSQLFRFKCLPSGDVCFNTLRPKQNGRHFPDDIFKCICLNEKCMNLD